MIKCQECKQERRDVYWRPERGKTLCGECNLILLRQQSPTGLLPRLRHVSSSPSTCRRA